MRRHLLTLALIAPVCLSVQADTIKRSTSGICHAPDSAYYDRTKNFTAYLSLEDCLASGGRLPKGYSIAAKPTNQEYSRDQFGSGWGDLDGDCQDSRQEALIAQSTAPVRFKDSRDCHVASGRWISPYSGEVIHNPSKIDIDHVVPLKWAWEHGAKNWPRDRRIQFANDPANLLSVEASLNRQKSAKGPDEWLPPANQCQYIARFYRVATRYGIALSTGDKATKRRLLATCKS